jgi:hypothetical protein
MMAQSNFRHLQASPPALRHVRSHMLPQLQKSSNGTEKTQYRFDQISSKRDKLKAKGGRDIWTVSCLNLELLLAMCELQERET